MFGGDENDIVYRLKMRAFIRRNAKDRKSVQEGKEDRLADLLDEAAETIKILRSKGKDCRLIPIDTDEDREQFTIIRLPP